jgi:hypothetical protein
MGHGALGGEDAEQLPSARQQRGRLHGPHAGGRATVFPQAIGLAATWDTFLMTRVAEAIAGVAHVKGGVSRVRHASVHRPGGRSRFRRRITKGLL